MTHSSPTASPQAAHVGRRGFLGLATWAIGGLISLGFAVPGLAYLLGPALRKQEEERWIPLGATSKVELGTPTLFKANIQRQTGWIVNEEQLTVFVLTEDGREFTAMSNICTHLGCRVRWIADQTQFFCPCHNGVFDKDGNVLAGPPPRPLDRYPVKVENGQILILGG
jgi:menaquinol-cytochrome c reductase iron-sulfur subunit